MTHKLKPTSYVDCRPRMVSPRCTVKISLPPMSGNVYASTNNCHYAIQGQHCCFITLPSSIEAEVSVSVHHKSSPYNAVQRRTVGSHKTYSLELYLRLSRIDAFFVRRGVFHRVESRRDFDNMVFCNIMYLTKTLTRIKSCHQQAFFSTSKIKYGQKYNLHSDALWRNATHDKRTRVGQA